MKPLFLACIFLTCPLLLFSQPDSIGLNKKRLSKFIITESAAYSAAMTGLSIAWYSDAPQSDFRFFNDNSEWLQMDKLGHSYSAFQISRLNMEAFLWAGMKPGKAAFWGAVTGMIAMDPIEVFDGFSAEYGASWGDLLANTSGSLLFWGQHALWKEIRIYPKFSFYGTNFASQRPNVLGKSWYDQWLKDYNGQTYWWSFDLDKFFKKTKFPKILNIAFGYGANEMIYAENKENYAIGLHPYRQYFIGLDLDLTAIKTKNRWLKKLLYLTTLIRLPAPALEYNEKQGFNFHFLYF